MDIYTILIVLCVIVAHWISDFVFQAEVWALGKRKDFKLLVQHTITYSTVLTLMLIGIPGLSFAWLGFFLFTFITHTITDFFTSKWVGNKFDKKHFGSPIPNFGAFSIIGLDQVIHYITVLLSLYFFLN